MKCNHCGAEIADDSTFCESCGKKIENKQSSSKKKKTVLTAGIVSGAIAAIIAIVWLLVPKNNVLAYEELYPIQDQNGKWGYIDEYGSIVISPQFDYAAPFSEKLAMIFQNDKSGYIDRNGQQVIYPQFENAGDFHEGFAGVMVNGKFGFIDENGKIVIIPQFDNIHNFHEGLAAVRINEKWGYIDQTGNMVVTPRYDQAGDFYEGLAGMETNNKYGYIDKKGNTVIAPIYFAAGEFHDGLAPVKYTEGAKVVYINKKGEVVIQTGYDFAGNFSEGIAPVEIRGSDFNSDRYGYIDKTGKNITPVQYERIASKGFSGGITAALLDGSIHIIDKNGNEVNAYLCNDDADFEVLNGMIYVCWSDDGYKSTKNIWLNSSGFEVYSWVTVREAREEAADSTAFCE